MSYIGVQPIPKATLFRREGTLDSASNTINVSEGYQVGNVSLYVNGAHFKNTEYAATDGVNIVLETEYPAGTHWIVEEYRSFEVDLNNYVARTDPLGAAKIPTGTTAQRPSTPQEGDFRRNSEYGQWEGYDGSDWSQIGGASGGAGNPIVYENDSTVTQDYTIPAGKNAMSAGPMTISDGVTVTVADGARWVVI